MEPEEQGTEVEQVTGKKVSYLKDDAPIVLSQDANPNLALYINSETLQKWGQMCREEYDADKDSRIEFDKRRAGWLKLFSGIRNPKNFPWDNASNINIPLLAMAVLQFQARAYDALIPPKEIVKVWSVDGTAINSGKRASRYMNYQLQYGIEDWEEEMDRALLLTGLAGSAYKKTYYDQYSKEVKSETLTVDEFVTSYKCKNLDTCPRASHILWMQINDIRIRETDQFYINTENIKQPLSNFSQVNPSPIYTEERDKAEGVAEPLEQYVNMRPIIEQHRLLPISYDPLQRIFYENSGIEKPFIVWFDYESSAILRISPAEYYDPVEDKIQRATYFTAYGLIPNPDSHYSLGFGHFVDYLNEAGNSILNQIIDAGTLANVIGGFVAKRSGIKRGNLKFSMGQFQEVEVFTDDIRKALYQFNFKPPSNVLFQVLGLIKDYVKDITSTADWMGGKAPPSDTAASTMLAVIEQGLKLYSTIQKRLHRSFRKELKKIFILNRFYLDEKKYFVVQDSTSPEAQEEQAYVGRKDFENYMDVVPVSDPNVTSKAERLIRSKEVLTEIKANPLTAQNKKSLYIATRSYLSDLEARELDQMLPEPQEEQPKDLPPTEENSMVLKETIVPALEQQDHADHILQHEDFMNSSWNTRITQQGKNVLEAHIREHLSFMYIIAKDKEQKALNINNATAGGEPGVQ